MHRCTNHCESQSLDLLLALHKLKVAFFVRAASSFDFGCVAHELLAVSIGNRDAAELLQNGLERLLRDVLKPFAEISQREFKLGRHSV